MHWIKNNIGVSALIAVLIIAAIYYFFFSKKSTIATGGATGKTRGAIPTPKPATRVLCGDGKGNYWEQNGNCYHAYDAQGHPITSSGTTGICGKGNSCAE